MTFNQIYDDRVVKTTINIPLDMMQEVKRDMRANRIPFLSVYLRALIQQRLEIKTPVNLHEFEREQKEIFLSHQDPVRKYSGSPSGEGKSGGFWRWKKKK